MDTGEMQVGMDIRPLAARMRPDSAEMVAGQNHLLAPGGAIRNLLDGAGGAVILWGPPGVGKTTLARLVAHSLDAHWVELSAVNANLAAVRETISEAQKRDTRSIVFIDEIHRFSKNVQDALLPAVENNTITLIGATTENPSFSINSALLSRARVAALKPLTEDNISHILDRALADKEGLAGDYTLTEAAEKNIVMRCGGDARVALNMLEVGAAATESGSIDVEHLGDEHVLRYDRDGDGHYDVASAYIKSVRGSDVDAALHWLAVMIVAGEDPRFIARRLIILASEDVGMADPSALGVAVAAADALSYVGLPEARLNLAQATIYLCLAPKSNSVYRAIDDAITDVRAGKGRTVPPPLRDKHSSASRAEGAGVGYHYPHDSATGVVAGHYVDDDIYDQTYYTPSGRGEEARYRHIHAALRAMIGHRSQEAARPTQPDR